MTVGLLTAVTKESLADGKLTYTSRKRHLLKAASSGGFSSLLERVDLGLPL